jgi:hypothetical protein
MALRTRWISAVCLLVVWAGSARAEGPGIRLGDRLVLHLGLGAEFRYDTNVFFQANNPTDAFLFSALPSIDLATRPPVRGGDLPHTLDFRLHAAMRYNEFITTDASLASHRMFGIDGGVLVTLLPFHPFTVDLFDNYVRFTQPPYSQLPFNLDRDTNELGVRMHYAPGGRRLEFLLGYVFGLDFFEVDQLKSFDLLYHRFDLRAQWKFYPKTAVYLLASERINTYQNTSANFPRSDSYPLEVTAGVVGLITTKLSVNAWVGYGNGFYVSGPSPNTAVGGLDLRWRPNILSSGGIGYKHDFVNALLGNYFDIDTVYASWSQAIWRFTANVRLAYANQRYQGINPAQAIVNAGGMATTNRTDNYVSFDFRLDYPFKDWLGISFGYNLQFNSSDARLSLGPAGTVPVDYTKSEVWLRLGVLY